MGRTLVQDFADGAFFHAYHSFECGVSAALVETLPNDPLPVGHADRINQFLDCSPDKAARELAADLWPYLDRRSEALYVGWRRGSVRRPQDLFTAEMAEIALSGVQEFLTALAERPATEGP